MVRIELDKVGLTFRVRHQGRITLKEFLVRQVLRGQVKKPIKVKLLWSHHQSDYQPDY